MSNELSESDSSDDDIIIDRTEESSINAHHQSSEDNKMDTDVAHNSEDRKFTTHFIWVLPLCGPWVS